MGCETNTWEAYSTVFPYHTVETVGRFGTERISTDTNKNDYREF